MSTAPIRFGVGNTIDNAALYSSHTPVTDIEFLRNPLRSRQTRYTAFTDSVIKIGGTFSEPQTSDVFAILGSNLTSASTVKLKLFEVSPTGTDLLNMDPISVGQPIPLGLWRAGIDPYNVFPKVALNNVLTYWFDNTMTYGAFEVEITHGLTLGTPIPNTTIRQPENGILSLQAEDGVISNTAFDSWAVNPTGGSVGQPIMTKSGPTFYWAANQGPTVTYTFTASQTSTHDVYILINATSSSNSVYISFDGNVSTTIVTADNAWTWHKVRTVPMSSGQDHKLVLSARDFSFNIDKIIIQPSGTAAPTGLGPAASGFGTDQSDENVSIRYMMLGDKVELDKNMSYGNVMKFLTDPEFSTTQSGFAAGGKVQNLARRFGFNLAEMTDSDQMKMIDMEIRLAGSPFLVSAYPDKPQWTEEAYTMLGKFVNALEYSPVFDDINQTTAMIAEV